MGGMLTHPVTSKRSDHGESLGLRYGLSSMQGWRSEMEDAHDVKIGLKYGLDDWSYFAVFDGHAGKRAAAFAAWNLLEYILRDSQFELETENSEEHVYVEPDLENMSDPRRNNSGKDHSPIAPTSASAQLETISSDKTDTEPSVAGEAKVTSEEASRPLTSSEHNETVTTENDQIPKQDTADQGHDEAEKAPKSKFCSSPVTEQLEMVKKAIKSGFLRIDQGMRISAKDMSGCTAVCSFISPTHLFIANCGDSRAVLYSEEYPKFVTEDHKPFHPNERKRIIDAGGCATQRINGTLAVSRALGDFEFKKDYLRGPCEQLVSPEPEVTVIQRHPEDEFLILACDGIWDVMSNNDLCKFVRYKLKTESCLEKICSSVLDVCLHKGSRDNMSIIIVVFENGPKLDEKLIAQAKIDEETLIEIAKSMPIFRDAPDFNEFINGVKSNLDDLLREIVPPGAGIEAKFDLLKKIYDKILRTDDLGEEIID